MCCFSPMMFRYGSMPYWGFPHGCCHHNIGNSFGRGFGFGFGMSLGMGFGMGAAGMMFNRYC